MDRDSQPVPSESEFSMMNRAAPPRGSRELKVEDALLYLDQVKTEFSDRPKIYNDFLEIMKNFKAQSITTPGVIDQVKNLFRGHNKLILGFNTFLPEGEGYKIELSPEEEAYPQHLQQQHAISYVTNIRNRFADEPETYKSFLKILHTYQREQKGIKDVLEQVSQLFAEHPDLLMEFTFFLPDAVQEQAKERLSRAVREAETRRSKAAAAPASGKRKGADKETARSAAGSDKESKVNKASAQQGAGGQAGTTSRKSRKRAAANADAAASQVNSQEAATAAQSSSVPVPTGSIGSTYHSISTERKFFDQVKDLLTNSSRDAWSEFVKCLDLYSHDAISRRDMFLLVQELFGPGNSELLEEFKALISARSAYDSSQQDMWFSIPLTEIDFSQCRRCTPSYRILPSDYAKPICSGREGQKESVVLNDEWVSIPIGSEESYSFKHMRRNQYEEAMFRSEDDRFEIDMVIDTNTSCIRILEPIAEEINNLKSLEDKQGSAPKFSLQLEKSSLGVMHLNAISRLYGEHGAEILELLRRNPAGAIPVVLKRLKQKDLEWRKARQQLNHQWKEILVKNYDKSLDHRSFYFRQQDKRSYTTRFLVGDIKDQTTDIKEGMIPGVSYTCSPEISSLCAGMNAELYLTYHNKDRVVFKDVYKLLSYATETSSFSANEKEKMAALWRDLFRVILNMPVHFMYDESPSSGSRVTAPVESWPPGARVITTFGVGTVIGYNPETKIHEVKLSFGTSYLPITGIIGAESLSESAMEAIGVTKNNNGKDVIQNVSAPADLKDSALVQEPSFLFFGTQMCYVFLRLHHTLTMRLADARRLATVKEGEFLGRYEMTSCNDDALEVFDESDVETHDEPDSIRPNKRRKVSSTKRSVYSTYMSQLYSLVDGSLDATKYEDSCRNILGNKSYTLYTLDKIVQQSLKCLQALSSDDTIARLIGIFMYHRSRPGGTSPALYQAHVSTVLSHTLEEVYRLQFVTPSLHDAEKDTVLACQYLGVLYSNTPANTTGDVDEYKAPKLVLEDDDDDDQEGDNAGGAEGEGDDDMEDEDAGDPNNDEEDDEGASEQMSVATDADGGAGGTPFSHMVAVADGMLKPTASKRAE